MSFYYKRSSSRPISIGDGIEAFPLPVKIVVIGDCYVGKTSLLDSHLSNSFQCEYQPTVFDANEKVIIFDDIPINLKVCDTSGEYSKNMETIRSATYLETDVFIACFSVTSEKSFDDVFEKWIPEIKHNLPNRPILLVGTKSDLRDNQDFIKQLLKENKLPVKAETAQKFAHKYGLFKYLECSALSRRGIDGVFEEAIRKALDFYINPNDGSMCCIS